MLYSAFIKSALSSAERVVSSISKAVKVSALLLKDSKVLACSLFIFPSCGKKYSSNPPPAETTRSASQPAKSLSINNGFLILI